MGILLACVVAAFFPWWTTLREIAFLLPAQRPDLHASHDYAALGPTNHRPTRPRLARTARSAGRSAGYSAASNVYKTVAATGVVCFIKKMRLFPDTLKLFK